MSAGVRLIDLHKSFGEVECLRGMNLTVDAGERVTLIGPSGSGKSTLLRLVMGLEEPTAGAVEVHGEPLWDGGKRPVRSVQRRVGMVFQHFHLFPHMDALGNVTAAPIHVAGTPKAEARERGVRLLEDVGLGDKLDARPSALSGGQKQRVAIARALAMEPDVLLFDEITSALDPELVGEVLGVVRRIATERDVTMLLVTHEMSFAADVSDRVVFMDEGRVVERGPPDQVLRTPTEERTREFLGTVLEGE